MEAALKIIALVCLLGPDMVHSWQFKIKEESKDEFKGSKHPNVEEKECFDAYCGIQLEQSKRPGSKLCHLHETHYHTHGKGKGPEGMPMLQQIFKSKALEEIREELEEMYSDVKAAWCEQEQHMGSLFCVFQEAADAFSDVDDAIRSPTPDL
jgi:hypothetical protein